MKENRPGQRAELGQGGVYSVDLQLARLAAEFLYARLPSKKTVHMLAVS